MSYLYLAGPMRGIRDDQTGRETFNAPAFCAAAHDLRARGHIVENPAEQVGGDTSLSPAFYLRADIMSLLRVEAIALLPGWERSRGARLEARIARALGLGLFLYTPERPDGLRSVDLDEGVLPP